MGDEVRQLSVSQFEKSYAFPDEKFEPEVKEFVQSVKQHYKPLRLFKQSGKSKYDSEGAKSTATLLEYGEKIFGQFFEDEEAADAREKKKQARGEGKKLAGHVEAAEEAKKKAEEARSWFGARKPKLSESIDETTDVFMGGDRRGSIGGDGSTERRASFDEGSNERRASFGEGSNERRPSISEQLSSSPMEKRLLSTEVLESVMQHQNRYLHNYDGFERSNYLRQIDDKPLKLGKIAKRNLNLINDF